MTSSHRERLASPARLPIFAPVTALSFAAYARTVAPGVCGTDTGELILAAWTGGVAHPPGFPLYVLSGWLVSHGLPLGSVALRLNLFSAACMAAGAGLLARLIRATLATGDAADASELSPQALDLVAIGAGLAFSFSLVPWSWATVSEVYALNVVLMSAMLLCGFRAPAAAPAGDRHAVAVAVLCGAGVANHLLLTLVVGGAIGLWWLLSWRRLAGRPWREIGLRLARLGAVATFTAAILYGALPLLARSGSPVNWGNPITLERLWWHISGKQYQVYLLADGWGGLRSAFAYAASLLPRALPIPGVLLAVCGIHWRLRRGGAAGRAQLAAFAAMAAVDFLLAMLYEIQFDRSAYYLPLVSFAAICYAWGITWVVGGAARLGRHGRILALLLAAVVVPAMLVVTGWRGNDRSAYRVHEMFARDALAVLPEGGLLLTGEWELYSPLLYLQRVEGLRPDATVIDILLWQNRPWYLDQQRAAHPALLTGAEREADRFLETLRAFERGEVSPGDRTIAHRYSRLWRAMLGDLRRRSVPVRVTGDVLGHLASFGVDAQREAAPVGVLIDPWPAPSANRAAELLRVREVAWSAPLARPWPDDDPVEHVRAHYARMAVANALYANGLRHAAAPPGSSRPAELEAAARAFARDALALAPETAWPPALQPLLAPPGR
ncbi:MAG: DUF2723 domain-containing protein [Candidatus Schekmanbacteria bacterium]|nr:DUF2723 domain-containing protein [Candidatus Schekmanbacteria bacterium]